jgi:hypothetical protein
LILGFGRGRSAQRLIVMSVVATVKDKILCSHCGSRSAAFSLA